MQTNPKNIKKIQKKEISIEKAETHKLKIKYRIKCQNLRIMRVIICLFLLSYLIWFIINDKIDFFKSSFIYFTLWCFYATFIYFIWTSIFFPDKKLTYEKSFIIHTFLIMNLTATIIFWTVLFPKLSPKTVYNWYSNFFLHIIPLVSVLLDFTFNRFHMKRNLSFMIIIIIFILYFTVNCLFSIFDEPVYSVITYKDAISYLYILLALIISLLGWIFFIFLQRIKFIVIIEEEIEEAMEDIENCFNLVDKNEEDRRLNDIKYEPGNKNTQEKNIN